MNLNIFGVSTTIDQEYVEIIVEQALAVVAARMRLELHGAPPSLSILTTVESAEDIQEILTTVEDLTDGLRILESSVINSAINDILHQAHGMSLPKMAMAA